MRYATTLAFVGYAAAKPKLSMSFEQFGHTVGGITVGFFEKQMPHLVQCAGQSEDVVNLINQAVDDFGQGDTEGVGNGLIDLGKTVKLVPKAIEGCADIVDKDIESFGKLAKTFESFDGFVTTVGQNWLLNDDVEKRWDAANAAAAKQDYYTYGENLGIMANELIQPLDIGFMSFKKNDDPKPAPTQPIWAIVLEVIFGLPAGFVYKQMPHLGKCIENSNDMVEKFVAAGYDFATGTYPGIAKGFYDLGDITLNIPRTIKDCPRVGEDAETWKDLGKTFVSFDSFITTVSQNVLLNYDEIMHQIDASNAAMAQENWLEFSFRVGILSNELIQPALFMKELTQ